MPVIYYALYDYPEKIVKGTIAAVSRLEHRLGRELLRKGLDDLYHITLEPHELDALISADQNGKPYLTEHSEIFYNITHCRGLVACAFHSGPVGIDAELTGYFPEVLIGRALSDTEASYLASRSSDPGLRQESFWRLWTLKEAYVKRSGIGVDTDLKAFSFSPDTSDTPGTGLPAAIKCSDPAVSCFQLFLRSGHIISLCTDRSEDSFQFDIVENIDLCHQIDEDYDNEHYPHSRRSLEFVMKCLQKTSGK